MGSNKRKIVSFSGTQFIKRKNLVNYVTIEIRERILSGDFKTGSVLPSQNELAQIFSVSVTVIREAMGNLQSHGLVEIAQGKRAKVKKVDSKAAIDVLETWIQHGYGSIEELHEVRVVLEGEIVKIAARQASDTDISKLENILQQIKYSKTINDKIDADFKFHRLLAKITQNTIFVLLIDTLRALLREDQMQAYLEIGLSKSTDPHEAILKAVRIHDSNAANIAMIDHLTDD